MITVDYLMVCKWKQENKKTLILSTVHKQSFQLSEFQNKNFQNNFHKYILLYLRVSGFIHIMSWEIYL